MRPHSGRVRGGRLFNLVPQELRGMNVVSVEYFKVGLDSWLKAIPDLPTTQGRQRAALTNSIIDPVVVNHQLF